MFDDATPSRHGHARGSNESPHVVTAYVVEPGGPCNRYHWDADSGVPVLDGVLHPANARGIDLARVPLLPTLRRTSGDAPRRRASWIEPLFDDPAGELPAGLGPSLLALVVAQPPNPPGTRLAVRLLGAARVAPAAASATSYADEADALDDLSGWIAIAVPTADPTLTHVAHVSDLPDDLRLRLNHALADIAPLRSVSVQRPDVWLTADRAMAAYRAARARGRLAARAAEEAERGHARERLFSASSDEEGGAAFRRRLARNTSAPAQEPIATWREIAPVSPAELRARGAAVYGEADHLIRWIPTRFARYLGELLLPDERILFFAECPPLTLRGWSGRAEPLTAHAPEGRRTATRRMSQVFEHLRTRHLQSGMLIITDRQALLLRDYAAPDTTMVQWGYVARSWPLGRLVAVRALSPDTTLDAKALVSWPLSARDRLVEVAPFDEATVPRQYARLLVALEGASGIQVTGAAFPPEMRPVLARAADLLGQFLPWPGAAGVGDRRVRLVPAIEPWRPTEQEAAELASLGGLVAPAIAVALEAATAHTLRPGEAVLAQARTPRTSEAGPEEAALLTLTPERLLIASQNAIPKGTDAPPLTVRALPVGSLTTATLHYSLLGCALSISFPDGNAAGVQRLAVGFPSPVIVPFRALYTRLLMGGPIAAPASAHGE